MPTSVPVREAPFSGGTPEIQIQRKLPLRVDQVQGNILAGFTRTIKTLIFLMVDPKKFKKCLKALVPFVSTTDEVLKCNRLFKQIARVSSVLEPAF